RQSHPPVRQSHQKDQACEPISCPAYSWRSPGPCSTLSGQNAQCSAATCSACSGSAGGAATLISSVLNPTPTSRAPNRSSQLRTTAASGTIHSLWCSAPCQPIAASASAPLSAATSPSGMPRGASSPAYHAATASGSATSRPGGAGPGQIAPYGSSSPRESAGICATHSSQTSAMNPSAVKWSICTGSSGTTCPTDQG